jgi:hypothetical protein
VDRKQKLAAIDAALTDMFGNLEARGVPEHVLTVVDQLEEAASAEDLRPSPSQPSSPEP